MGIDKSSICSISASLSCPVWWTRALLPNSGWWSSLRTPGIDQEPSIIANIHKRIRFENAFYDPYSLTDRKRLFSVYFFSLFSFFKERSLSLSEQPQTHLICSYHVAKNVFHQGNCVRIKIKKCKFNANWGGLKTFFKITQYADVVDIKFSVQTVLANIINTRSTGRTEYFVRRKSQTNSF